jgi:hypothetical protein
MGVLDDAIREHLELKRQHGAAEDEIARKEAEALGPARRGPAAESDEAYEPDAALEPEAAADAEPAPDEPEPVALAEPDPAHDDELDEPAGGSMAGAAAALGGAASEEPEPEPEPDLPVAETEPVLDGEESGPAPVEPTIDVPAEVEPPAAIEPGGREPIEAAHPPVHDVDRDPHEPPAPVPGATVEFDTLNHREDAEAPPAEGDEDVLEETPEFLRETPEHDRLWFEQKPPRDFDLDN